MGPPRAGRGCPPVGGMVARHTLRLNPAPRPHPHPQAAFVFHTGLDPVRSCGMGDRMKQASAGSEKCLPLTGGCPEAEGMHAAGHKAVRTAARASRNAGFPCLRRAALRGFSSCFRASMSATSLTREDSPFRMGGCPVNGIVRPLTPGPESEVAPHLPECEFHLPAAPPPSSRWPYVCKPMGGVRFHLLKNGHQSDSPTAKLVPRPLPAFMGW